MEPSAGLLSDFLSPESTVTSLLSSSGQLRSSRFSPEHSAPYRYRDKVYESASDALDAYIADFDRGRQDGESSAGRLVLPSVLSRPRLSTLRNRDVLREQLTDRELDYLKLPVSSLLHHGNRDRLSMTTQELLSIPSDGSMPVTHTSAFIQGLLSQSGESQPLSSSRTGCREDRVFSSHSVPNLDHHNPCPPRTPRTSGDCSVFKPSDCVCQAADWAAGSRRAQRSSSLHLPRWLTSHRDDMDCSELSSVPELKYPAWIRRCDPEPHEGAAVDVDKSLLPPPAPTVRAPPWVAQLEDGDPEHGAPEDQQQIVRDLTFQFAQHISSMAADRRQRSDVTLSDNRIESLIQKADQVLNSLHKSFRGEAEGLQDGPDGPAGPPDPVSCPAGGKRRSADLSNHVTLCSDSDAPAGGVTESPTQQAPPCSDRKQPGPVEALKQMLFRLQHVEAELHRQQEATWPPHADRDQMPVKQRAEGEAELESLTGASLQRALHHLSCLKLLVEEPRDKQREEEEEDKDEGRYSC